MTTAINNDQLSLGIHELVMLQGFFPSREFGPGVDPTGIPLGSIRTFAGSFALAGDPFADGQLLAISQHEAVFAILDNTFGGNGQSNFALPDLRGRAMVGGATLNDGGHKSGSDAVTLTPANRPGGGAQPFNNDQPSLAVNYLINVGGKAASMGGTDVVGMVVPFLGNFVPDGYHLADGAILNIHDFPTLAAELGTTYGGNGTTTFALPDLRGRTIIGDSAQHARGSVVGQDQTTITTANLPADLGGSATPLDNHQPSLALHYIIAVMGIFPSLDGSAPSNQQIIGEIVAYAGNTIPPGWALADGRTVSISQNEPLFSILGNSYGGDGQSTFALPDFRNHTAIEAGQGPGLQSIALGQNYGSDTITLADANLLPVVSINQASSQGDATALTAILFDVVFSENVAGFTANDIVLSGTAGATTAVVTPGIDAAHYTVSVSGMTHSGTVVASIGGSAASAVADGLGNAASTSVDNQVSYVAPEKLGDFNGDRHSDILFFNDNGSLAIWDSGQLGGAHINAAAGTIPASWHVAGKGDFDGNGNKDILWQNDDGTVAVWDNGQGARGHVTATAAAVPSGWHIDGVGDFDGNGHDDILWQNDNGTVAIWDNGQPGGGHVTANAGVVPGSWHVAGVGDFDGNTRSDVLWQNSDGTLAIWDNGQLSGAHITVNAGVVPGSWHIAGTGDFDGNGRSDIVWQNSDGAIAIWDNGQLNGAHITVNAGAAPGGGHIAGTGDFDGNGRTDILWQNTDGSLAIWDNGQLAGSHAIVAAGIVAGSWHIV